MEFISGNAIKVERELSELDLFTLQFVKILRKRTRYVIVSGYVSILLGRARVSEDIDLIIPKLNEAKFEALYEELKKKGYYCLNAEYFKDVYGYLLHNFAVRFAKNGKVIPNIELKFAKTKIDEISLAKNLIIKIGHEELIVSNLELQIAFKEKVLKSQKDIEDARHLRNIAIGHLNKDKIEEYKRLLHETYR